MPITDADLTPRFPRDPETAFFLAPQAAFGTPTYTGLQALHFTDFDPQKPRDPIQEREYGGADVDGAIDQGEVVFGDITVTPPLKTNLCLNEIGFWLAYLLGAPTSTDLTGGRYQHVFTSGKSQLPIGTLLLQDPEGARVIDSCVVGSLALAIAQGGGRQVCDFTTVARDMVQVPTATITAGVAAATAPPTRLFVPQKAWTVAMDGTNVGRLLSATLNYSADIGTDRYVDGGDAIGASYVGDPTASLQVSLRHVNEAQRALFDNENTAKALTLTGTAAGNHSIAISLPQAKIPPVYSAKDDKLRSLSLTATAERNNGSAMTITLINSLASY